MKCSDLCKKKTVIWGTGREAMAVAAMIRAYDPDYYLTFIDENRDAVLPSGLDQACVLSAPSALEKALDQADILVKSPGVSLYHPLIASFHRRGGAITSLMNMWFAEKPEKIKTLLVTGTKGKSTTATLIAHMANGVGIKTMVMGNVGTALTLDLPQDLAWVVVEMSSYQAADFIGHVEGAILTSLYPEHLDWHGSLDHYYRDKLKSVEHAEKVVIHPQALEVIRGMSGVSVPKDVMVPEPVPQLDNSFLMRSHNRDNLGLALAGLRIMGGDCVKGAVVAESYRGLPHRQCEIGVFAGRLCVDDSIATTPQAAIAAMEVYSGRALALIAGGYDRGIDYTPLVDYLVAHPSVFVIAMGVSGHRMAVALRARGFHRVFEVTSIDTPMQEAVDQAMLVTPAKGVIILSPAAPSFGLFKDYVERGSFFVAACAAYADKKKG